MVIPKCEAKFKLLRKVVMEQEQALAKRMKLGGEGKTMSLLSAHFRVEIFPQI
jgi:hypothetical protein